MTIFTILFYINITHEKENMILIGISPVSWSESQMVILNALNGNLFLLFEILSVCACINPQVVLYTGYCSLV